MRPGIIWNEGSVQGPFVTVDDDGPMGAWIRVELVEALALSVDDAVGVAVARRVMREALQETLRDRRN